MDAATKYRVTSDYERKDHNELTLKSGDIIEVIKKGKYIWYGRLNNIKGFFPSRIVAETAESKISSDRPGNILSSTAVTDKTKKEITGHTGKCSASMTSQNSENAFEKINHEPPLEDKRRTRAKSTGRPPSQVFMKETILHKIDSMDTLSTGSEDEDSEKLRREEKRTHAPGFSPKFSQLVLEMQKKSTETKPADPSHNNNNNTEPETPSWMKLLSKKKTSVSTPPVQIKKSESTKGVAPWMQEVQKRREHKLSLRGDEVEKMGQQMTKHTVVEINNNVISTKRTIDEKQIQAKSFNLETKEISTNKSTFHQTSQSYQSYALLHNTSDAKSVPIIADNKGSDSVDSTFLIPLEKSCAIEAKLIGSMNEVKLLAPVAGTVPISAIPDLGKSEPIDKIKSEIITPNVIKISNTTEIGTIKKTSEGHSETLVNKVSTSETISDLSKSIDEILKAELNPLITFNDITPGVPKQVHIHDSIETTVKVPNEYVKVPEANKISSDIKNVSAIIKEDKPTELTEKVQTDDAIPKSNKVESKNDENTITSKINVTVDGHVPLPSSALDDTASKNTKKSMESLLKTMDDFITKHERHSKEIKQEVQRLEAMIDQQREEMIAFIHETKTKLNDLIKVQNSVN